MEDEIEGIFGLDSGEISPCETKDKKNTENRKFLKEKL